MEQGSRHYASTRATRRLKLVALRRRPVEGTADGVFVGRPVVVVRRERRVDRESKSDGERGIVKFSLLAGRCSWLMANWC